jgi:NAD(P)-dependent dehydrogenase (short-subunit alcohol dehydrogenase family)
LSPNDLHLTDQVAVVTGGGGGIGRAIALSLASAGANLVIGDIVPERCEETTARVRELGRRALAVPTDVMDTDQVRALIDTAAKEFSRLDILVNNAGGVSGRPFIAQSERSWRRHIDLNLVSMLAATSAAVPVMIAGGRGGSIINVTSIEGSRAAPGYAVYAACKAGMNNFTRTLAVELGEHRIRVNAIAPDMTDTPGLHGNHTGPVDPKAWVPRTPEQEDAIARRIPLGRAGLDTECGNAAVFLASEVSSYVTGVVLPVDGGTWAAAGWIRNRAGQWTLIEEEPPGLQANSSRPVQRQNEG